MFLFARFFGCPGFLDPVVIFKLRGFRVLRAFADGFKPGNWLLKALFCVLSVVCYRGKPILEFVY